jgi:hypothetical protein
MWLGTSLSNRGSGWTQVNLFHIFSGQSGTRTDAYQVLQFLPVSYSINASHLYFIALQLIYSKTCLKWNLKGPEHFFAKARFPFNQSTHIKINPGHARI